jgi:3-phosphoglycerate kinase
MKFRFTYHAQYRLYIKTYSIEEIKRTILKPDFESRLSDGKIVSDKTCNGRVLRVVYIQDQNTSVIVSFYYLN